MTHIIAFRNHFSEDWCVRVFDSEEEFDAYLADLLSDKYWVDIIVANEPRVIRLREE